MKIAIEIVRKTGTLGLDVENIEDVKWIVGLFNTSNKRQKILAEAQAFLDKQTIS